ncbi:drug/metabolite transporter (DMT)-like permease [Paenibacillus rhizosphaerae]|uniref:Drug/metabolite transporter (DMT)-like permease n=1 Tax=Paenibacillus rhizosphaerae TaxID=297318 RepID=A0A839TWB4_9BACL|nr:DMT family transporter [Paenibacillus rhizosphaerae]MBB3129549.1 drug/metabolite transporter (DMT)-like permease [Paenibacillus rhizosphaerae]
MNRSRIADLSLLIVAMMWGCTFLIVQHAVRVLPPLAFNGIRFLGAAVLLALIITFFYRSQWRDISGRMLLHSCLLGLFLFLGYAFQTVGLLYTTTSNAGFITGLSVVFVPFLALLLLKSPISRYTWISALLAAAGLYLLAFAGTALSLNKGDFLIFLCAVAFALHVAYTGVFAPRYSALPLAAMQMAVVGLLSIFSSLLFEDVGPLTQVADRLLKPEVIWALLVSIGPTSAFAFWIQTVCQKYTNPSRVAVIFAMEPVFAALTGVTFGGEVLGAAAGLGCICIFAGMILAELKSAPREVQ